MDCGSCSCVPIRFFESGVGYRFGAYSRASKDLSMGEFDTHYFVVYKCVNQVQTIVIWSNMEAYILYFFIF